MRMSIWSPTADNHEKLWFQHPLQDGMANSERQLFHAQGTWAKSPDHPDHGKVIPWPTGRLNDMSLCLSACTNCRFLELHLWCKTAPVFNYTQHTYEEGAQRLHDISRPRRWWCFYMIEVGDTYPSSGDTSTWYNWYICLSLFFCIMSYYL